jgi:MFS family permease
MSFLSSFMWILLPFTPYDELLVTFVMTLSSFGLCFADVMADSLLVEVARDESDQNRGIIQSWSWMLRFTGGLLASGFGALAYDKLGSTQVFLINSMVPVCIAVLAVYIPDEHTVIKTDWKETSGKLMTAVKNPNIYCPALFLFLICVMPSYGSAMTFFYERELGFTPAEFGALDVLGFIVQIIGTFIYKKWLRKVSFPKIFGWALFISFVLEQTLIILVLHLNREMGIPDYVFAFTERVVITLAGQFITMPMVVLGARVCPVGIEGTLYALLMSVTNLGGVVSSEWGSMLTTMFGITSTNFTNLWKLMLLCNTFDLIPLGCLRLLRGITGEMPI